MARRSVAHRDALPRDLAELRRHAGQVFSRTAGAPLLAGNAVRVLQDGAENYPAWEAAIASARRRIHVEMYIFKGDAVGRRFSALLAARARAGVEVRVLYDWFGCGLSAFGGVFEPLVRAGGEVRVFNPPSFTAVLGWMWRNHRKLITVDGEVAFVSGLCIGQAWEGRPDRQQDPWRDTGVEIRGPAAAAAEHTFAQIWGVAGGRLDPASLADPAQVAPQGSVPLRLIPTEPFTGSLLRVDLLVSSLARQFLWIHDAYFIGHGPYLEALRRAAHDGVDVRLLLPQGSDVGWTVPVSRTLYRTLLEAGVRIFEWNGTMMHAKTAVADGRWARVGSTNLNLNSWIGNWELDVAIEDAGIARAMADRYLEDLSRSTEIVLADGRGRPVAPRPASHRTRVRRSARRMLGTVTGISRSVTAAVTGHRPLESFEFAPLLTFSLVLLALAGLMFWLPWLLAWPAAALAAWMGVSFVVEGLQAWRRWKHQ